jgi:hypothetical protein
VASASNKNLRQAQIEDKTLVVHCLKTGGSQQNENPYQRKGIGTRMVRGLIEWAKVNGWERIEAGSLRHSAPPVVLARVREIETG